MILACSPTQQVLGVNPAILAGCLGFFIKVIIAYDDSASVGICMNGKKVKVVSTFLAGVIQCH